MIIKERIEKLLNDLKKLGLDRRTIEREMGYDENYLDQVLSRGGNKRFLATLERYALAKSNKNNGNPPTKKEEITALRAAVKVLTLEVVQLKHQVTKESATKISLEIEKMMKEEAAQLLNGV